MTWHSTSRHVGKYIESGIKSLRFIFEMKTIYYLCVLKRNPSITGAKHCPRARKGIQQALRLAKLETKPKRVNTLTFI